MKQILLFLTLFLATTTISHAQNRAIARGAEPGELYLTTFWYGIYGSWGPPYYNTLRTAVYHITENGKKVTIQYDVDYFADYYTTPSSVMQPQYILADATPGVLYAKRVYTKNYYDYTQLWVSFDYGESWELREENIGAIGYTSSYKEGVIYRGEYEKVFISNNYANTWSNLPTLYSIFFQAGHTEEYFEACEFISLGLNEFFYTNDCYQDFEHLILSTEHASGEMPGFFPDVYRGSKEGEVYIHSWFSGYKYKASFSANTGHTFRHVYVNEDYQWQNSLFNKNQLLFMSDREEGVFYILNLIEEKDIDPWGWHLKLCVHYYRDYGETLVDVYCHDINKNYENEIGINEINIIENIVIFPNPTTGELIINNEQLTIKSIEFFDVSGKKQLTQHFNISSSHYKINISELNAGIYFVHITTKQGIVTKKIIKN